MYAYNLIKFDGYYLTGDGMNTGSRIISGVTGLEKFILLETATTFVALDGTVHQQFLDLTGVPISISFELIDRTTFNAMVASIRAARADSNTPIELLVTGNAPDLTLAVKCTDTGWPDGGAIDAGLQNVTFNFITV